MAYAYFTVRFPLIFVFAFSHLPATCICPLVPLCISLVFCHSQCSVLLMFLCLQSHPVCTLPRVNLCSVLLQVFYVSLFLWITPGYVNVVEKQRQMHFSKSTFSVFQPCELFHSVEESHWYDLVLP